MVASHLYNNRKTYARYAKKAGQAGRRAYARSKSRRAAKMRARRGFGERVGTSNCKKRTMQDTKGNVQARVLYGTRLDEIPSQGQLGVATANCTRSRNVINFRGVKLCMYIQTKHYQNMGRIGFNVAIVAPKDKVATGTTEDLLDLRKNFFRSNKNDGDRSMDFPGVDSNWNILPITVHCQNLNTDKFNVIAHKRRLLNGPPGGSNNASATPWASSWKIEQYFPIKRQLRFDQGNDSGTAPISLDPLWVLWWCDDMANGKSNQPGSATAEVQTDFTTYFRHTDA